MTVQTHAPASERAPGRHRSNADPLDGLARLGATVLVFIIALAAAVAGPLYARGANERHVTGVIDDAFKTIDIEPADAVYFEYSRRSLEDACSHRPVDDRWVGVRAASEFSAPIDHRSAAAGLAAAYESDGWTVHRWSRPASETVDEARGVDAYRGEDRVFAVLQDGQVTISAHSGPCSVTLQPLEHLAGFERVDSFD